MKRNNLLFGIGLIFLVSLTVPNVVFASDWYNQSWSYRQPINISNTAGDLTNYQVKIELNSSNVGANFDWSDNSSIRFTNSTDDLLNFWIESWNSTADTSTIWVNVTSLLNNTNTTIYMYYGNPSASSESSSSDTFGSNLVSFWTFSQGSTNDKISGNNFTNNGAVSTSDRNGNSNEAYDFSNDYMDTDHISWGTSGVTFCQWVNYDILNDDNRPDGVANDYEYHGGMGNYYGSSKTMLKGRLAKDSSSWWDSDESPIATGQWYHICVVFDNDNDKLDLYINGSKVQELTGVTTSVEGSAKFTIGAHAYYGVIDGQTSHRIDGKLDDIRFYNKGLSSSEINQFYASSEPTVSIGSEETSGGDTTPPTYSDNSTNSTLAGTNILHSLKWQDDTGLSGYIFSFDNGTGTFVNDSWVSFSGTLNWSNVTKSITSTVGATIRWKVYANDTSNNWATSDTYSYVTTSAGGEAALARFDIIETETTIGGKVLIRKDGDI